MSTEQQQDAQEFIDLRTRIRELESKKLILERTLELLFEAGHVTKEQVRKAHRLAISLTPDQRKERE